MARCLWIDASNGIAGDMTLGALLDAGASLSFVRECIAKLHVERIDVNVELVRRHGMRALHARVSASDHVHERHFSDIREILQRADLPVVVRDNALKVFSKLADAEALTHGIDREEVHFHEVGALDALADVVGSCAALYDLGVLAEGGRIVASAVAVGAGTVRSAHGEIPVPVPAVLTLLASSGATVVAGNARRELCTPTGAALLVALVDEWGDIPTMLVEKVGIGAGTADPSTHLNVTRVALGTIAGAPANFREDTLFMMHSNVDDLDPRLWPSVLDELCQAGALDAWTVPTLMRKGRPGRIVQALVPPVAREAVFTALVTQSSSLGARFYPVDRYALARDQKQIEVDGERISIKRGLWNGKPIHMQPEYLDVLTAAKKLGLPIRQVLQRANAAAQEGLGYIDPDSSK